jgi:transcriptional regulator with XRE-family HTH domain
MNNDREKLGIFLAQLRKDRKLTQKELADKLYVSVSTISKWEKGVSTPNIYFLEKLAEVLQVPAVELIECQIDIGVEKTITDTQNIDGEKYIRSLVRWMLGATFLVMALSAILYLCYYNKPVEMNIVDAYFETSSDFYDDNVYFVIVEYDGHLTDDLAYEYAMEHREAYEKWFQMAEGVVFSYFDRFRGRESVMDAKYKVVFVPYRE